MKQICEIKFGSHLYGTNTPDSDLDFKGIYLPSAKEICLGNYPKTITHTRNKKPGERNTKDDIDVEVFSLDRFLELLCDGQTVALDVLFSPKEMYSHIDPKWGWILDYVYENRKEFLSSNVNAFVGYARQQAAKYGVKGTRMDALKSTLEFLALLPENEKLVRYSDDIDTLVRVNEALVSLEKTPLVEVVFCKAPNGTQEAHLHVAGRKIPFHATVKYAKEIFGKIYKGYGDRAFKAQLAGGKDYKALSHAIRVNCEAKELLETGFITFPRPEAQLLIDIKNIGSPRQTVDIPFDDISEIIEKGLADLMESQEISVLRAEPNREFAKDLVYRVHKQIVQEDT